MASVEEIFVFNQRLRCIFRVSRAPPAPERQISWLSDSSELQRASAATQTAPQSHALLQTNMAGYIPIWRDCHNLRALSERAWSLTSHMSLAGLFRWQILISCEWENLELRFTRLLTTFALKGAAQVFCTSLWACARQYTSAVQQPCAYFKGVDGFPLKAHGSSKRSVKLASEGELACWGLCHFIAHWLKMSAFILGMLHLRGISGKAVPFCSMSENPPGCQSQKCCSVQKENQSWALEVFICLVCVLISWTLMCFNAWWQIF